MLQKYLTLFWLIAFFSAAAQKSGPILPLRQILSAIEKQHQVQFNFLDQDVAAYHFPAPERKLSLSQKIDYLTANTSLDFQFITPKSIGITKRKKIGLNSEAFRDSVPEKLPELSILNYLTTGISKKNDGSLLITPQRFGLLPGLTAPDVLQTMQQLPGIISADETVSNTSIRGGTHDQNLFLWNGIRMYQTGHFFGLISAFNPLLAQEISIYKNGGSAFYGDSVSGIVAISTQNDSIAKTSSALKPI